MKKLILTIGLLTSLTGYAENPNTTGTERALGAFALSYVANHFYRDQLGLSRPLSTILAGVTTAAAAYAYDRKFDKNNGGAYAVGYVGAVLTFNLFESDKAVAASQAASLASTQTATPTQTNNNNQNVTVNVPPVQNTVLPVVVEKTEHVKDATEKPKAPVEQTFIYTSPVFTKEAK